MCFRWVSLLLLFLRCRLFVFLTVFSKVISHLIDHAMNPQAALDAARFCIMDGEANGAVSFECGVTHAQIGKLAAMGHVVNPNPEEGKERLSATPHAHHLHNLII